MVRDRYGPRWARKVVAMDKETAEACAAWGVPMMARSGHVRNIVVLEDERGSLRLYRVTLAERETRVDTTRRLRNAMDGQGCAIRGWTKDEDGTYKVVAEVRQQA